MSDSELRSLLQRAVNEAVERHLGTLRTQLADHIYGQIASMIPASPAHGTASPVLSAALKSIQQGTTQADILAGLLQCTEPFASRSALLVLRGGSVVAWRGRGFAQEPKGATLDSACPLIARALSSRAAVSGPAADFDSRFLGSLGAPAEDILLIPMLVRDKVAALLCADSGVQPGGRLDAGALDCLVRFAGTWVELAGIRKSGTQPAGETEGRRSFGNGHAASGGTGHDESELQVEQPVMAASAAMNSGGDPFPPAAQVVPQKKQAQAMDEGELHKKAHRFARLLVDEIRLYNQEKVEQGRQNGDLFARLAAEIQKSRSAYDKRFGQSLRHSTDYFEQELVRILANNNPALLGSRDSS